MTSVLHPQGTEFCHPNEQEVDAAPERTGGTAALPSRDPSLGTPLHFNGFLRQRWKTSTLLHRCYSSRLPCIHVLCVTYCHDINSICLICSLSPKSVSKEGSDSSLPPHSVHRRDLSQRHLHFEF